MAVCPTTVSDKEDRPFVDREEFIEAFETAFQNIGEKNYSVLVYYGIGGIGKTSLRKELPKKLDKYNEKYQNTGVIWATVDFSIESHRQMDKFLGILKNELNQKCGVKFHLFDIAHAAYWRKVNPQIPLSREGYSEDSIVTDLLDSFGGLVSINYSSIKRVVERAPDRFKEWSLKREKEISRLPDMEALDIEKTLPVFFANDLADYLQKTSQSTVIFIDSYEALWEKKRGQGSFNSRDEWIRQLIANLPKSSLWVICGRNKLRWEEVDKDWNNYLEQYKLEKLPEKDAVDFLNRCGIKEEEIQKVIIEGSEGVPYYLELAVDTYTEIAKTSSPKPADFGTTRSEIFDRFMKYLGVPEKETLKVLSTPRFWNQDIFTVLINNFNTGYPLTAFSELNRFSFVQETEGKLQLHPLMRESLQVYQNQDLKKEVHNFMLDFYSNKIKEIDIKSIAQEHENALIEAFYHAKEVLEAENLFNWFIKYADPFAKAALWKLNAFLYEELLLILKKKLGDRNFCVASSMNNLANVYKDMGEYEKASVLYSDALNIYKEIFGEDHPCVATTLNNLAYLYQEKGMYKEALPLYELSLSIRESKLDQNHPDIAQSLNNLSALYQYMGEYKKALHLCERAQYILKQSPNPDNHYLAITLGNLATLYFFTGHYQNALEIQDQVLNTHKNTLGSNHPSVATTLINIAEIYVTMEKYDQAKKYLDEAFSIRKQTLGLNHPSTGKCLNHLAGIYKKMGKNEEARKHYTEALDILENTLGLDHPNVAITLNNLAEIHVIIKEYEKALVIYKRVLGIFRKQLGSNHPSFKITKNNILILLSKMEKAGQQADR